MKFNKMKLAALAMSALMAASTVSPAVYAADLFSDGTVPAEEVFISEEPEVVEQEAPAVEEIVPVVENETSSELLTADPPKAGDVVVDEDSFEYEEVGNKVWNVSYKYTAYGNDLNGDGKPDASVVPDTTTAKEEDRQEATCENAGGVTLSFTILGRFNYTKFHQTANPLGHNWKETGKYVYLVNNEPIHGSTVKGYKEMQCLTCGSKDYDYKNNGKEENVTVAHEWGSETSYWAICNTDKPEDFPFEVVAGEKDLTSEDFKIQGVDEIKLESNEVLKKIKMVDGKPVVKVGCTDKNHVYYAIKFCINYGKNKDLGIQATKKTWSATELKYYWVEAISNIDPSIVDSKNTVAQVEKAKDFLDYTEGKKSYNVIPLEFCNKEGIFRIHWYTDEENCNNDKSAGKASKEKAYEQFTVAAHHRENVYWQFKSEDEAARCTIKNGSVVNNYCVDVDYTKITVCDNRKCYEQQNDKVKNVKDSGNVWRSTVTKERVVGLSNGTAVAVDNHVANYNSLRKALEDLKEKAENGLYIYSDIEKVVKNRIDASVTSTATCTENGVATVEYKCNLCKKVLDTQDFPVKAYNHDLTTGPVRSNYVPATCAAKGSYDIIDTCKRCGKELKKEHNELDPLPHTFDVKSEDSRYLVKYAVDFEGDKVVNKSDSSSSAKTAINKERNVLDGTYKYTSNKDGHVGIDADGCHVTAKLYKVCGDCGYKEVEKVLSAKNEVTITEITEKTSSDFCGVGTITLKVEYDTSTKDTKKIAYTKQFNYFETLDAYKASVPHDWIVTSETVVKEATAKEAGSKTVVSTCSRCGFSKTATVEIPALGLPTIAGLDITVAEKAVYTGEAVKAAVVVKSGDKTLVEGTDYDLAYSNNVECGKEAVVTITGKGDYQGTVTRTFEIDPAEPVVTSAKSTGYNSVKVTWDAAAGAKSYRLYYRGGDATKWTLVRNGIKGTELSYASSDLVSGVTYRYTVVAVNGNVKSTFSAKGKCAAIKPTAPVASVTFSGKKAVVTWKKVAGASGYIIQSKAPDGKWTRVGTVKSGTKVTWTDKKAVSGTSYRVRAYRTVENVNVYGPFSAAAN